MHVLAKRTYSNFDMPYDTPVAVSENKAQLEQEAEDLNLKRNAREVAAETKYHVLSSKVKYLGAKA